MPRWDFIEQTIMQSTLQATLARNRTYSSGSQKDKLAFRCELESALREMLPLYQRKVDETNHEQHIIAISNSLSEKFASLLHGQRFRIGSTQKALNLYLKCMWCLDKAAVPPHCPFDAVVIGYLIEHLPIQAQTQWTKMDSIDDYRTLVAAARIAMSKQSLIFPSLSHWELAIYENHFSNLNISTIIA